MKRRGLCQLSLVGLRVLVEDKKAALRNGRWLGGKDKNRGRALTGGRGEKVHLVSHRGGNTVEEKKEDTESFILKTG